MNVLLPSLWNSSGLNDDMTRYSHMPGIDSEVNSVKTRGCGAQEDLLLRPSKLILDTGYRRGAIVTLMFPKFSRTSRHCLAQITRVDQYCEK